MLENLNKKQKIIFGIIIAFMVCIIVYYIYSTLNNVDYDTEDISTNSSLDSDNTALEDISIEGNVTETKEILVHVSGCVKEEKIVSLPEGSRVNDAIEEAGGLTEKADLTNINLAYILEDGEKIYIPKKGEEISENNSSLISDPSKSITSTNSSTSNKQSKININKATQAELETLPGIGPSTALKIIDYKNKNGNFKSIEDLKNVSGIGNAKYEKVKDYITIK